MLQLIITNDCITTSPLQKYSKVKREVSIQVRRPGSSIDIPRFHVRSKNQGVGGGGGWWCLLHLNYIAMLILVLGFQEVLDCVLSIQEFTPNEVFGFLRCVYFEMFFLLLFHTPPYIKHQNIPQI